MEHLTNEDLKVIIQSLEVQPFKTVVHVYNKIALEIQKREAENGKSEDKK